MVKARRSGAWLDVHPDGGMGLGAETGLRTQKLPEQQLQQAVVGVAVNGLQGGGGVDGDTLAESMPDQGRHGAVLPGRRGMDAGPVGVGHGAGVRAGVGQADGGEGPRPRLRAPAARRGSPAGDAGAWKWLRWVCGAMAAATPGVGRFQVDGLAPVGGGGHGSQTHRPRGSPRGGRRGIRSARVWPLAYKRPPWRTYSRKASGLRRGQAQDIGQGHHPVPGQRRQIFPGDDGVRQVRGLQDPAEAAHGLVVRVLTAPQRGVGQGGGRFH